MIPKVVLLCALVAACVGEKANRYGYAARLEEQATHQPYSFRYNIDDYYGNAQYHKEDKDAQGRVTGSYGYKDDQGNERIVEYVADEGGYRAYVKTNEPGTHNENPADVVLYVDPAPLSKYSASGSQSAPLVTSSMKIQQRQEDLVDQVNMRDVELLNENLEEEQEAAPKLQSYAARQQAAVVEQLRDESANGYGSARLEQQKEQAPAERLELSDEVEVLRPGLSSQQMGYGSPMTEQLAQQEYSAPIQMSARVKGYGGSSMGRSAQQQQGYSSPMSSRMSARQQDYSVPKTSRLSAQQAYPAPLQRQRIAQQKEYGGSSRLEASSQHGYSSPQSQRLSSQQAVYRESMSIKTAAQKQPVRMSMMLSQQKEAPESMASTKGSLHGARSQQMRLEQQSDAAPRMPAFLGRSAKQSARLDTMSRKLTVQRQLQRQVARQDGYQASQELSASQNAYSAPITSQRLSQVKM